jgi:transposase
MDSVSQILAEHIPPIATGEIQPFPFSQNIVQLTQEEHIQLKWEVNYWKAQHAQLKEKLEAQHEQLKEEFEARHTHLNKKHKALQRKLDAATARIRDLKQRLFGKKSEKGVAKSEKVTSTPGSGTPRPRGQQKGSKGHGRTARPDVPIIEEEHDIAPEEMHCPICAKAYNPLPDTEDSQIIEIEVKPHIRRIKRKKYAQACDCDGVKGLITAPSAARLIPKSSVGISVWTEVLLNKFLFSRALNNLCIDYACRGLPIAPGTIVGGLKKITGLFEPLIEQLIKKQLTEDLFHNDETGWKVFETIEGKVGYRWWLWVTQSQSVVYYTLAPSRSGDIPIDYFAGLDKHLEQVIVVCDRYKGYIRLARENPIILLAFCWAHVRRDFLDAARSYPELEVWMFDWVERIGELYYLNKQRLRQWDKTLPQEDQTPLFQQHHQALEQAIQRMAERRQQLLDSDQSEGPNSEALHSIQRKVLNSLKNHWDGLTVFVDNPQVPMDNNTAERRMRNPGMGRKNYYGSGRQWSAGLAAMMFSLFQTVLLWGLNPHHWLYSYLDACANNGGEPPSDIAPFIPWMMSEERKQQRRKPLPTSAAARPTTSDPPDPP